MMAIIIIAIIAIIMAFNKVRIMKNYPYFYFIINFIIFMIDINLIIIMKIATIMKITTIIAITTIITITIAIAITIYITLIIFIPIKIINSCIINFNYYSLKSTTNFKIHLSVALFLL